MSRLILLSYDYPPNNGGIARLCGEIVKQCKASGTTYLVLTSVSGPIEKNIIRFTGHRVLVDIKIWWYLIRHMKKDDILLTGTYHPAGLLAYLANKPCYYLAHGAELMHKNTWFNKHIWEKYRSWLLSKGVCVLANSHYTANLVKDCSPKASVEALPLGVDNTYFHPTKPKKKNGKLNICSISRLEKFKAHDFIINTIASMPYCYKKKIEFTIGGKGPYRDTLEKMVADLGLNNVVKFAGFVSDEELRDFYSENDLFVLCTREDLVNNHVEGFGLVFAEAQACGTPCVGSLSGGIPDAIKDGHGGWLIEQDDGKALSLLLQNLIDNPNLIMLEREKALARVSLEMTWDVYFSKLLRLL